MPAFSPFVSQSRIVRLVTAAVGGCTAPVLAAALLLSLASPAGAVPAPITINIPGIGTINMSATGGTVSGTFTATRKNVGNVPTTIWGPASPYDEVFLK